MLCIVFKRNFHIKHFSTLYNNLDNYKNDYVLEIVKSYVQFQKLKLFTHHACRRRGLTKSHLCPQILCFHRQQVRLRTGKDYLMITFVLMTTELQVSGSIPENVQGPKLFDCTKSLFPQCISCLLCSHLTASPQISWKCSQPAHP